MNPTMTPEEQEYHDKYPPVIQHPLDICVTRLSMGSWLETCEEFVRENPYAGVDVLTDTHFFGFVCFKYTNGRDRKGIVVRIPRERFSAGEPPVVNINHHVESIGIKLHLGLTLSTDYR